MTRSILAPGSSTQDNDNYTNSIHTSNLTKIYKNFPAVSSLSIDVNSGDIFGFLGPNGAGKTTTIRMMCGLLSPSSGTGKVAGLDIVKDSLKIRRIIGLLPESSGFYNWMNAKEYLLYFARLYRIEPYIARKRTNDLLEKVGLAAKSFVPIGYYSRGMKQRIGLARTLINNPKIIFLDEPTLGLDPKGQQDIQKILLDLNHEKNVTVFLSSHALSEVSSLCNRIAIVNRGRLIAQGSIDELRRLVGSSSGTLLVRILNSPNAKKALSDLPLQIKINSDINNNDKKLIDIYISEQVSESANKTIEIFEKAGLQIYEVRRLVMSLEDIFFKLTYTKSQQQLDPDAKAERWKNNSDSSVSIDHTTDLQLENEKRSEK
jgi:ABC-2 type transport system ATP-binding protein